MNNWTKERIEAELKQCSIGRLVHTTMSGRIWISVLRALAAAQEKLAVSNRALDLLRDRGNVARGDLARAVEDARAERAKEIK